MLTLGLTVLATAYFIVPELISRFILSFFAVLRKTLNVPKSEELVRGAFWALVPLAIAWFTRNIGFWSMPAHSRDAFKVVFGGLSSDKLLTGDPADFFRATTVAARANLCLLSRAYSVVIVASVAAGFMAHNVGFWREKLKDRPAVLSLLFNLFIPRISEWHLALSPISLKDQAGYTIEVDVMLKSGILYRGSVGEKNIGADGSLQTLILTSAQRFLRDDFVRDRTAYDSLTEKDPKKKPLTDAYWRKIPGTAFLIVGADVSTVNVRHVETMPSVDPQADAALDEVLRTLLSKVKRTKSQRKPVSNSQQPEEDGTRESPKGK